MRDGREAGDRAGQQPRGEAGTRDHKRTDILLHSGNKPYHSKGCILLGPVSRDSNGAATLGKHHPLSKLRLLFYGTNTPNATPDRDITIIVTDPR